MVSLIDNVKCELFVAGSGKTLDGTEMMRYVEPFSANAADPKHPMLVLVYRQRARVQMEEYQRGCSPSVVSARSVITTAEPLYICLYSNCVPT